MGRKSHTLHPKLLTSMIPSNGSRKGGVDGTFSLFVSFTNVLELKYHPTFVVFSIQNYIIIFMWLERKLLALLGLIYLHLDTEYIEYRLRFSVDYMIGTWTIYSSVLWGPLHLP